MLTLCQSRFRLENLYSSKTSKRKETINALEVSQILKRHLGVYDTHTIWVEKYFVANFLKTFLRIFFFKALVKNIFFG